MDNLDHTNVVQTSIAKWTLTRQLQEIGILSPGDSLDNYENFMHDFRESKPSFVYLPDIR